MAGKDWWRGAVIYQIYPRSFMDANGDGVGDLKGITSRLDHIADLGVDAVWLSPIFTSPMQDMGYDISDYTDIDPTFGTLEDFDALVARAHALGLKVMIDQVISHSSDQNPLFVESRQSRDNPKADWYVWADPKPDGSPPNNWMSLFGGSAWTWDTQRRQNYLHNFLSSQPDLNFHNPEVREHMLGTMRFWLDRGVDGFRLDVVNFYFHDAELRDNPPLAPPMSDFPVRLFDMQQSIFQKTRPENLEFLQTLRAMMDEYDDRATVGEIGELQRPIETMAAYTSDGRLNMGYSFEMLGQAFDPAHFRTQIETFFASAPNGWPCWAFSNHDVIRHVSRWAAHGVDRASLAKLCAAMILSFEGSICLYQGEELGQTETDLDFDELTDPQGIAFWPGDKGRDGCRTPMVWDHTQPNGGFSKANRTWLPVKPAQLENALSQQAGADSVHAFYRQMLALRRSDADLSAGATRFLEGTDRILAFERGDNLVCLFNPTKEADNIDLDAEAAPVIAQSATLTGKRVELGPNGFAILRKTPAA